MGSHLDPSAKSRDTVDRCSFENGQRLILFPPTVAREQDGTAVAACTQATSGNFGGQVARPNISVGADPFRRGGIYARDRARAKPAPAKVEVNLMRRSRLPVFLMSLMAVGVAAGGLYWLSSPSTQHAAVQQKKSSQSARRGGAVPVVTQLVTVEDFPIRRRTIGILESPATVIIRSR